MTPLRALAARPLAGYAAGAVGVVGVGALIHLAGDHVNALSMAVCFQLLVLVVSGAFGLWPGLATAVVSTVAFNWLFVPPVHTLAIEDASDGVSLVVFTATAVITGYLAEGFRHQRRESEERRRDAELLSEVARAALGEVGPEPSMAAIVESAAEALGVEGCRVALDGDEAGGNRARVPVSITPSPDGFAVPLFAGGRTLGLLEVGPAREGAEPRWGSPRFVAAVADLVAVAAERARLIEASLEAESLRRSDGLKTALLQGVSHEFRTPLTAIRTAADALRAEPPPSGVGRAALLGVMVEETARLDRLVANLLDLSRLEAGGLQARLDWCAPVEMVAGAIEAAAPAVGPGDVELRVDPRAPLVRADAALCERILVNLLINAARHGAPPIVVDVGEREGRVEIAVADAGRGLGLPADRAFAPFVAGRRTGGTGVGLALALGLAEAQGASLTLEPGGAGARLVLGFPPARAPDVVPA